MRFLSLFSGIEAASLAWKPLGWKCVGVSEIDNFASAVLAYRFPDVPNLGDITKITEEQIKALGRLDVIIFGSPCQDLSVAGKRKGFVDAAGEITRSGLFFAAMRVIGWARKHCGLRFALWENVPGAFSSNGGADFAAVVGQLAGLDAEVPPKGWGTEGCAVGTEGMVEWSTLDAQWFGVAQRRRRVFALADFGDWAGRPPILLERQSLRGDSAPSREAGQDIAAGTLRSTDGGCDVDHARAGHLQPVGVQRSVLDGFACKVCGEDNGGTWWPTCEWCGHDQRPVLTCVSNGEGATPPVFLTASNLSKTVNNQTPLLSFALPFDTTQITSAANRSSPKYGDPCHPLAAGAHPPAIAFNARQDPDSWADRTGPLDTDGGTQAVSYVVRAVTSKGNGEVYESQVTNALCSAGGGQAGQGYMAARIGMQVRRLIPMECERLQGMPDNWTLIPMGKKMAADGPRYKALGNSMAVPVIRWIGRQIDFAMLFDVTPALAVDDLFG